MRVIMCMFISLFLAACAGAYPGNPQNYAGLNDLNIHYDDEGRPVVSRRDGKGREALRVKIEKKTDGSYVAEYESEGVTVTGQEVRAAVEQAVSEDVANAFPEFKDLLTTTLCATFRIAC